MKLYLIDELLHYCNVSFPRCSKIHKHKIGYYDLTFVLDGEMNYVADGELIALKRNDLMLLPPNTTRERLAGDTPVRYVSFNFTMQDSIPIKEKYLRGAVTAEIKNAVSVFLPSHLSPSGYTHEKCVHLLGYILYTLLAQEGARCHNAHVEKMLAYIDANITKRPTLREISAHVGLSREYASYLFKREMRQTLTEYVNVQKLSFAHSMIVGGEMKLSEIAELLAFENYNYFSRSFKRKFGISPIKLKHQGGE